MEGLTELGGCGRQLLRTSLDIGVSNPQRPWMSAGEDPGKNLWICVALEGGKQKHEWTGAQSASQDSLTAA